MTEFTPDVYETWDDEKRGSFLRELKTLKTRFELSDIPDKTKREFPTLAAFMPNVLNRGKNVVRGMDMDKDLMESAIREIDKFKIKISEPLEYSHGNGHGVHLVHLPIVKKKDGSLAPDVERFMTDLFGVLDKSEDRHKVVDGLMGYLLKAHEVRFDASPSHPCTCAF